MEEEEKSMPRQFETLRQVCVTFVRLDLVDIGSNPLPRIDKRKVRIGIQW
jgi:hypothetical protein